jgi:hypothetical protein
MKYWKLLIIAASAVAALAVSLVAPAKPGRTALQAQIPAVQRGS